MLEERNSSRGPGTSPSRNRFWRTTRSWRLRRMPPRGPTIFRWRVFFIFDEYQFTNHKLFFLFLGYLRTVSFSGVRWGDSPAAPPPPPTTKNESPRSLLAGMLSSHGSGMKSSSRPSSGSSGISLFFRFFPPPLCSLTVGTRAVICAGRLITSIFSKFIFKSSDNFFASWRLPSGLYKSVYG